MKHKKNRDEDDDPSYDRRNSRFPTSPRSPRSVEQSFLKPKYDLCWFGGSKFRERELGSSPMEVGEENGWKMNENEASRPFLFFPPTYQQSTVGTNSRLLTPTVDCSTTTVDCWPQTVDCSPATVYCSNQRISALSRPLQQSTVPPQQSAVDPKFQNLTLWI